MSLPYRWYPSGTVHKVPEVGDLIPLEHRVWRCVEVRDRDEVDWSDADREWLRWYKPEARHERRPRVVVLRPIDETTRKRDRHYQAGGAARYDWAVYPDEHYPICADCLEPLPCRDKMAERVSGEAAARMGRYETAGVCPACQEVVTRRQESLTWPDNLEVLGGPPVTFHLRAKCRWSAMRYEQCWVAADPERRRATLSCPGHVVNHNDGTYQCTELAECPGPRARHPGYSVCRCPDCHARGSFGCTPSPNARNQAHDTDEP